MLSDHITMTSADLTSRLTVYKLTPCNFVETPRKFIIAELSIR